MKLFKYFPLFALLIPQFAFAAFQVPLSATTTSGTIFAYPANVNGTNPALMAPFFFATSTTATSNFAGNVNFGIGASALNYTPSITTLPSLITQQAKVNSTALLNNVLFGEDGYSFIASTTANTQFPLTGTQFCDFTSLSAPVTNTSTVTVTFPSDAATSAACGTLVAGQWGLGWIVNQSSFPVNLATSTGSGITFTFATGTPAYLTQYPIQIPATTTAYFQPIQTDATHVYINIIEFSLAASQPNPVTALVPLTFGTTFSTTTLYATTSLQTQGVFFSSSTLAASQFPYASTTEITAATASSTSLVTSGIVNALHLGGASGAVSAYGGSSCTNQFVVSLNGAGAVSCSNADTFAWPFNITLLNSFATTTDATNTSIWTQGIFISSSTAQASQFPYASTTAITTTNASTTNLIVSNTINANSPIATSSISGALNIGTTTQSTNSMLTISNFLNGMGGIIINTWTNVTNAFTIRNSAGTTVFNIDTTVALPEFVVGSTTAIAQITDVAQNGTTPLNNSMLFISSTTQTATTTLWDMTNVGHVIASSTNPVLSSCGTGPTLTGDDVHGEVVPGTSATACTITFGQAWSNAPICTVSNQSMSVVNAMTYTISASALTISMTGIAGDKVDYICEGVKGIN